MHTTTCGPTKCSRASNNSSGCEVVRRIFNSAKAFVVGPAFICSVWISTQKCIQRCVCSAKYLQRYRHRSNSHHDKSTIECPLIASFCSALACAVLDKNLFGNKISNFLKRRVNACGPWMPLSKTVRLLTGVREWILYKLILDARTNGNIFGVCCREMVEWA